LQINKIACTYKIYFVSLWLKANDLWRFCPCLAYNFWLRFAFAKDLRKYLLPKAQKSKKADRLGKKHENNTINKIENEKLTNSQPEFYHFCRFDFYD
jgi:hypothetical protein